MVSCPPDTQKKYEEERPCWDPAKRFGLPDNGVTVTRYYSESRDILNLIR